MFLFRVLCILLPKFLVSLGMLCSNVGSLFLDFVQNFFVLFFRKMREKLNIKYVLSVVYNFNKFLDFDYINFHLCLENNNYTFLEISLNKIKKKTVYQL